VGLGDRLAGQDPVEGVAQQRAGHRLAVAGGAVVEGAAVGEPAVGVVDEQVGGAHGPVVGRDLLALVQQVGEAEAGPAGLLGHAGRAVLGVGVEVVAVDGDRGQVPGGVVGHHLAEPALHVAHIRAVVAQEHHQQRTPVQVGELHGGPVERRQLEVVGRGAERHHE
jgi:hypothetical protein